MIKAGPIEITPLGHGSLMIVYEGRIIHVDPYTEAADYSQLPQADHIWITHEHFDHLDQQAIDLIKKADTKFVAAPSAAAKLEGDVRSMRNGDQLSVDNIRLEAVPAYNVIRERSPGEKYHPRGMGNGYVVTFDDFRLYIAGDTEAIPEMSDLTAIDLAIVPIMMPYTMSPEEALRAIQAFLPRSVLAYHTTPEDAQAFAKLVEQSRVNIKVL